MSRTRSPKSRGFAAIGLHRSKDNVNVGSALRACGVYDAAFCAVSERKYRKNASDTMKAFRHTPLFQVKDLKGIVPYDCVPVAVDIIPGATPLPEYKHPERAFYIFGPEDGTLGKDITDWCRDVVYIPTERCMNLGATVNVILYDRMSKRSKK